ncbi:MAG: hypothetical protein NC110_05470 [Ruminococcus sp.]|nr:hypothetical protein [Ruminococcus sp.]
MSKEIDELNERFQTLKEAASKSYKKLPEGMETQTDIKFFNDLCTLYGDFAKGYIKKDEAIRQGGLMRTNYIEAVRDEKSKKLSIKRDCRDYAIVDVALTKLNKKCTTMTAEEREDLYLEIISVVEPVSARLIKEKVSKLRMRANVLFDSLTKGIKKLSQKKTFCKLFELIGCLYDDETRGQKLKETAGYYILLDCKDYAKDEIEKLNKEWSIDE